GLLSIHSNELIKHNNNLINWIDLVAQSYAGVPLSDPEEIAKAKKIISQKGDYPIFSSEFHCPSNIDHNSPIVERNGTFFIDPLYFNYVSIDPLLGVSTYQRIRTNNSDDPNFNKQLYAKEPLNSTVITWCYSHRELDAQGQPRSGSKDIVLFLDGHTEVRETSELMIPDPLNPGLFAPWLLEPRRK
ncbi:MAG: hypothetical protein ACPLPS_03100, partial [bacterium]